MEGLNPISSDLKPQEPPKSQEPPRTQEPLNPVGAPRGRGKFYAIPRSERKSIEVFGGAPTTTRYLPGVAANFGVSSAVAPKESKGKATPSSRIDPPWANPKFAPAELPPAWLAPKPAPNSPPLRPTPSSLPESWNKPPHMLDSLEKSPPWSKPDATKPSASKALLSGEMSLDIPAYKPKRVVGGEEAAPKPVVRHQRSSSDTMTNTLPDLQEERQSAINKLKQQVNQSVIDGRVTVSTLVRLMRPI